MLMRRLGLLLPVGSLALCLGSCSFVVSGELETIYCSEEGAIGAPACEAAQICAAGVCSACLTRDLCGDNIDNDCNEQIDDECRYPAWPSSSSGTAKRAPDGN